MQSYSKTGCRCSQINKMVKIHGLVYIAIGIFISVFSYKTNYDKLIFFFYLGFVFIFVGIVKIIIFLIRKSSEEQKVPEHHKEIPKHHQANVHHQPGLHHQQSSQTHRPHQYKYCSNCRNVVRITDKFCNRCGARV